MIQPKHPGFAAFMDIVLEGQPSIAAVRRRHDEKARLLAHDVPLLEVEGLTATLDDRDAGLRTCYSSSGATPAAPA